MKRAIHITALVSAMFLMAESHGQELSNQQLTEKIKDLEKRIEALERSASPEGQTKPRASNQQVSGGRSFWRQLKVGMTEDQVREILGEPTRIERMNSMMSSWYYDDRRSTSARVRFINSRLDAWSEPD